MYDPNRDTSLDQDAIDCVQKLGPLEDVEDRLGISIITLINAFDKGIKYKDEDGSIYYAFHLALTDSSDCLEFRILEKNSSSLSPSPLRLCEYGKTWVLATEDFELVE